VVIDGVPVMEDRRILSVDEDEVMAKANEAFVRVLGEAGIGGVQTVVPDGSDR